VISDVAALFGKLRCLASCAVSALLSSVSALKRLFFLRWPNIRKHIAHIMNILKGGSSISGSDSDGD
jgi:hypothetical protein